jgi:thiamine-phosphate pyrophosphorylase
MAPRPKHAEPRPQPRLYLLTPRLADAAPFRAELSAALDAGDVAAVLLRLADTNERTQTNIAKALTAVTQAKDIALLLDGHPELVARAGCDGAHLTGIETFEGALSTLKPDRIAGAGGLATRHDAMVAAEAGADYVMFGEPDEHGAQPSFDAIEERVSWWAEVFECPCIAYAASLDEIEPLVKAGADFVALGDWIWRDPAKVAAVVADAVSRLKLPETAA